MATTVLVRIPERSRICIGKPHCVGVCRALLAVNELVSGPIWPECGDQHIVKTAEEEVCSVQAAQQQIDKIGHVAFKIFKRRCVVAGRRLGTSSKYSIRPLPPRIALVNLAGHHSSP